jgi:hypothetical protein
MLGEAIMRGVPAFGLPKISNVAACADEVDDDSEYNERGAKPERRAVGPRLEIRLPDLQRLQEQTEAGDNKAESHKRQTWFESMREKFFPQQDNHSVRSSIGLPFFYSAISSPTRARSGS